MNTGCSDVNSILVNPGSTDTVYVGTNSGVFVSTDQGVSWSAMNSGLEDNYIYCLGLHPDNYLFAATNMGGMYRWDLNFGISENKETCNDRVYTGATIFSGPLRLSGARMYRVYDISGREVEKGRMAAGIYFIEIDGKITNKIITIK